ncbi:MAG: hypothetical protein KatS3mg124_1240 [Porticoccaceae bacterium]|nr:MAG: hypothetical protein KatS3mg124_1240 [Porticoccaceae bacterium]
MTARRGMVQCAPPRACPPGGRVARRRSPRPPAIRSEVAHQRLRWSLHPAPGARLRVALAIPQWSAERPPGEGSPSDEGNASGNALRRRHRRPRTARCRRAPRLGLPRRRRAPHLRRHLSPRQGHPHPGAPRAGGGPRRRRLCPRHRQAGGGAGHLGAGGDQRHHRHRHRLHGLHPPGGDLGPGATRQDRRRRLPGDRHDRNLPAHREAQLHGQAHRGDRRDHRQGVPHRHYRPTGAGGDRHPQKRHRPQLQGALPLPPSGCGCAPTSPP